MSSPDEVVGIVLAAGRGERLRPLTDAYPKPCLPVLNRPLLTYALDALKRAGIRHIGVNAFHLAEQVRDTAIAWWNAENDPDLRLTLAPETTLLGTGGGARQVWERMGRPDATVVVVNGDAVVDFELQPALNAHRGSGALASLLIWPEGEGRVWMEPVSRWILGLPSHRPGTDGHPATGVEVSFTGLSLLEPDAMRALPEQPGCLIRDGLINLLGRRGAIRALPSPEAVLDVGTPARYALATSTLLQRYGIGVSTGPGGLPPDIEAIPPVLIAGEVSFDGPARVGPSFVAGGRTRIAAGTWAHHAVAWDARLEGLVSKRLQVGTVSLTWP